jgi:hypothetical protein
MTNPKYEIGTDVIDVYRGAGRIIKIWASLEDYYRNFGKECSMSERKWRKEMMGWFNQLFIRPSTLNQHWYAIDIGFPNKEKASKLEGAQILAPEEQISILKDNTNLGFNYGFKTYNRKDYPW